MNRLQAEWTKQSTQREAVSRTIGGAIVMILALIFFGTAFWILGGMLAWRWDPASWPIEGRFYWIILTGAAVAIWWTAPTKTKGD